MITAQQRHTILHMTAAYYNVPTTDILSRSRRPHIVEPRQVCAALLVIAGDRPSDAARFLDRNHATIVHALNRVHTDVTRQHAMARLSPLAAPHANTLTACIYSALATTSDYNRACASDYIHICILGQAGRINAVDAYQALAALAANPDATRLIARALELHDEPGAAALLHHWIAKRIAG